MILLAKFLPVPVHPCRERVRGFLGFGLLRKPDTAFKMTFFARCCPKSLSSRSFCSAGNGKTTLVRGGVGKMKPHFQAVRAASLVWRALKDPGAANPALPKA